MSASIVSLPRRAIAEALVRMVVGYKATDDRDWHQHAWDLIKLVTEGRT